MGFIAEFIYRTKTNFNDVKEQFGPLFRGCLINI